LGGLRSTWRTGSLLKGRRPAVGLLSAVFMQVCGSVEVCSRVGDFVHARRPQWGFSWGWGRSGVKWGDKKQAFSKLWGLCLSHTLADEGASKRPRTREQKERVRLYAYLHYTASYPGS